ncbi:hypothetical protein Ancab_015389 [Ancistrocladus abbreviatus]
MRRVGEIEGKGAEKEENLGEKLQRGLLLVGKRCGLASTRSTTTSTPVLPWRVLDIRSGTGARTRVPITKASCCPSSSSPFLYALLSPHQFSSRKLAAALWEFLHYFSPVTMQLGVNNHRLGDHHRRPHQHHRLRHHHRQRQRHHHLSKDKCHGIDRVELGDPSPGFPDHHHDNAPYNAAVTPARPIGLKGKIGNTTYGLKSSTELLEVLNRIWSREEQHEANTSLVKSLKTELGHARARIKELLQDQQTSRHAMDEFMKRIADDKLVRKGKEQERIDAALQSVSKELEDERKLRMRSETKHRRLARELFDMKVALSSTLKEIEKERRSRQLLGKLCDEFARGIQGFAQQMHAMKPKSDKDWTGMDDHDDLILHICGLWLDEHMQMKGGEAEGKGIVSEKNSAEDRLRHEIEAFLCSRQIGTPRTNNNISPGDHRPSQLRRQSVESIPLNDEGSASQCPAVENSALCDSCTFEMNKTGNIFDSHQREARESPLDREMKTNDAKKMFLSNQRKTGRSPLGSEVKFEEQVSQAAASGHGNPIEATNSEIEAWEGNMEENSRFAQEGQYERQREHDMVHGLKSNAGHKLIRELLLSEGGSIDLGKEGREVALDNPTINRSKKPIRPCMMSVASSDLEISESCTKMQPIWKESTLEAKLREGRPRGQRLKILKASS